MTVTEYLARFAEPDPRYSPVPAWWWSGEPLHWPKMRWQMDRMHAMGLRNVVVIGLAPSGAMFGSDADDPPFLSERWWDFFRKTCDHARSLGMFVWFYDQIGFSGANFQTDLVAARPDWSGERLKSVAVACAAAGDATVTCPAVGTPIGAYFVADDAMTPVKVVDGSATHVAAGPGTLRLVYSVRQAYDYFNPDACQALLDTVHREYARRLPDHIGTTIVGSFQDELPELPTWGPTFADSFAEAFGYRLEPVLHRLFEPGDVEAERTRVHYHQHRANLAERAFFRPFYVWYESHGMQCGYDQQSPAREARVIGCIEKYADYQQTMKWYALPGSDLHGNGKLHASIAFLNDRPRVWLEGFHTTGWGGTIADTFDWLLPYLQSGVTLYNPHAVYYATQKGWWEWAPPSTCWRQPYAMHYKPFADTIARLTKLLSRGTHQASVGVLFPTTTAQSAIGPEAHFEAAANADRVFHETIGSMRWHQAKTGTLDAAAIDHHVLDEAAIQSADIDGQCLVVHGVALRAVVLPAVAMLHRDTLAKLQGFSAHGGRVIAIGTTTCATTAGPAVDFGTAFTCVDNAAAVAAVLADLPRRVSAELPFLHRRDGEINVLFVPAVNGMATVVKWDSWFAPMEHTTVVPERYADHTIIRLSGRAENVWRFDPETGRARPIVTTADDKATNVALDFEGSPYAVLVWDGAAREAEAEAPKTPWREITIDGPWTARYEPTLPEDFADIYDPARPERRWPTTPRVRWSDTAPNDLTAGLAASADAVLATFGPRGRIEWPDGRRTPLVYSPRFGIEHDKLHQLTLGPKAHVPEEFVDLGKMAAGESATIHFGVVADRGRRVGINIGTNAAWTLRHDDVTLTGGDGYNTLGELTLKPGENAITLTLTARSNATIRAFWCFFEPDDAPLFVRPERLITPSKPVFGQRLRFSGSFDLPSASTDGRLLVATAAMASVFVDGIALGRQGGFDPYRLQMRGQTYALPPLSAGRHTVSIDVVSPLSVVPVAVDGEVACMDGSVVRVLSGRTWSVRIEDGPAAVPGVQPKQDADGAAWLLRRRPHPLPGTAWLDGGRPGVLDLPIVPPETVPRTQWLSWTIPPGATAMRVPLNAAESVAIWIDGNETRWGDRIDLANGAKGPRVALVRLDSRESGGAVLTGPVTYEFGDGELRPGSWTDTGLASYSGAIRMRKTIELASPPVVATLDLSVVRGTVETFVNGRSAGVKFMSPYRFEVGHLLHAGANEIELVVTNTLANHMSTWSPTRCWSPDQLPCGVMGPVVLRGID